MCLLKNAQNVAQSAFCQNEYITFSKEKGAQIIGLAL
jgi:hypothetical protein